MKNRLGCGINHSVVLIAQENENTRVFVWGRSNKDKGELGMEELEGATQNYPFPFATKIDGCEYSALEVSCGDSHTAMILSDGSLKKLKLIFSPEIDISQKFQAIIKQLDEGNRTLSEIHKEDWKGHKDIKKKQIIEFFGKFCDDSDADIPKIVDLLMKLGKKDKISFKEFRDQLYGARLDNGRVLTWGCGDNGRLGRDLKKPENRFVRFQQDVSIDRVSCGGSHCLAISSGHKLFAWGANAYGQLGIGNTADSPVPVPVSIDTDCLSDVAGGGSHSVALTANGEVFTWGLGEGGRLGHGEANQELYPRLVEAIRGADHIAAGHSHSGCIIKGAIFTWGIGTYARLGHGNLSDVYMPKMIEYFKGRFMQKICLSFFHSVVLSSNGEVWAWGNSKNGRLGIPTSFGENQLVPTRVGIGSLMAECKIIDIACGYKHGLALAKSGHIFAWGCGLDGKLGLNTNSTEEPVPKEVKMPKFLQTFEKKKKNRMPLKSTEVFSVSCSSFNTYALTNAGELMSWGANSHGQCGVQFNDKGTVLNEEVKIPVLCTSISSSYSPIPLLLESLKMEKIKNIASNGEYAMAVSAGGKVYVWGSNAQGQLGTGFSLQKDFVDDPTYLTLFKRTMIKTVSCGPSHSAFLAENGELHMCGSSENGRLGLGDTVMNPQSPYQYIPRLILGLPNIKKVACGVSHTVAIDYSNGVWSWGSGWYGKLGLGDVEDRISPHPVDRKSLYPKLDSKLKEVACGEHHTLLLTANGTVYAAGFGVYAGISLIGSSEVMYFNAISQLKQVKHLACGRDHSIVVTSRGQLFGWGSNASKKLGSGFGREEEAEIIECRQILVKRDIVFSKVSAGSNHSAAITVDGVLHVWGACTSGRLGLGFQVLQQNSGKGSANKPRVESSPAEVSSITAWLRENDVEHVVHKAEDEEDQYLLQSMLKNEPVEQSIETLLTQDQKIVSRLEALLMKFDQIREVQQQRENMMSYIESLIVAKIETMSSIANPDFTLTLPQIISKNFQLYEFLLACMQTHPCYMAKLVEYNPHIPTAEVASVFKAVYGDMSNNPQKLRKLMQLYKLTLKISVANTDFQRSMKMKAGDLSAHIYFYLLESQACNNDFYAGLASEIMRIVDKVSSTVNEEEKAKVPAEEVDEDLAENEILLQEGQLLREEEIKIKEEEPKNDEKKHKIRDALNYKQLDDLGALPPELTAIREARRKLYEKVTKRTRKKIKKFLTYHPTIRKRIAVEQKLSNEVKFMYKDIPSRFRERFKDQCNNIEGKSILDSKIVLLFFAPLVTILREPIRLKRINLNEFKKSMGEDTDFDDFIKKHFTSFCLVADYIEDLGEWRKLTAEESTQVLGHGKKKTNATKNYTKQCKYRKRLVKELTDVEDLNLTDLSLGDMLATSLEPNDSSLTISLEELCTLHLMLKSNLDIIQEHFSTNDPVYLIIESLGDVESLFHKILSGDTKSVKLNLRLPTRWLLRERALQSCPECNTPLTYSLLKNPPDESKSDLPLNVPTTWRCWSCGNTQDGWHMKCTECLALRRDFPKEALFKNFKQYYISEELSMFTQILYEIPAVPPHISPIKFIRDLQDKQPPGSYLLQKLKEFVTKIEEIGNPELEGDERSEKNILRMDTEAKFEYELRANHKAYLDTMNSKLGDLEDKIKLICLQFSQNTKSTLSQCAIAVAKGKNVVTLNSESKKRSRKAQGRFTVDYLFKKKILDELGLPDTIKKNTSFYFTEIEDGAFDVRVVLKEDRNYLCLPREPIEVKIIGFEIDVEKLKAMRRTMNFRSRTSFESGKVIFNVFYLVRMLGSLLGKCKQGDFQD